MKTNILMVIVAVTSMIVNAQPQNVRPYSIQNPQEGRRVMRPEGSAIPSMNFDNKQREEMSKIHTEQIKERTQTRNLLQEKRARLEVLQTAEKPDMREINKMIDEIAAIQAQEMKNQSASRQKIRSLLTDEQRTYYDAQVGNMSIMPNSRNINDNRFPRQGIERPQRAERFQRIE